MKLMPLLSFFFFFYCLEEMVHTLSEYISINSDIALTHFCLTLSQTQSLLCDPTEYSHEVWKVIRPYTHLYITRCEVFVCM